MRLISVLAAGTLAAATFATGCAASESEETGNASADALSLANTDFEATLDEIQTAYEQCAGEGCGSAAPEHHASSTGTTSIRPLAAPRTGLRGWHLCDAVRPLAGLGYPYFFVGASGNVTNLVKLRDGGVDLVFDLRNQQAALFHYHNHGYSNLIGLEANVYTGYGFGRKANVLDAWSGRFQSADATVELPVINIGVGGSIFRAPDNSIIGGAVEATIGVNALGPLGTIEGSYSDGVWEPWDVATRAFGRTLWLSRWHEGTARANGRAHAFIQFDRTRDLGLALLQTAGPGLGGIAAAQATGIASLQKAGLTIEQACPAR